MIIIKTGEEIAVMREGGAILASVLKKLTRAVKPGVSTADLEKTACELIIAAGGRPSFKGYKSAMDTKAYPTALCTSINEEVVHAPALPGRILDSGDIVGIDIGMEYPFGPDRGGYYTDMAATVAVGRVSREAKKLIQATRKCLEAAIAAVRPGNTLNDIGRAVQSYAEARGFSVVRDLVGHGVGTAVHEDPPIPNYEIKGTMIEDVTLASGMTLALEPMVNAGHYKVKNMPDGFTIATADGSLSAHFEHTVAVTKDGCEILTIES